MQDVVWIGGIGEDDSDDHSGAKIGGEPCPTGRANLFDTRKITSIEATSGKYGSVSLSCAGVKGKRMRACQCTVVHKKKKQVGKHVFY